MTNQPVMYGNKTFADVGVKGVSLHRGIGHARIMVDVRFQPHAAYATITAAERPWEVRLGGWVSAGHAQNHLAELTPIVHVWPRHDYPTPESANLYGTVTFRELELLHTQRPGIEEPLQFTINVNATSLGAQGTSIAGMWQLPFYLPASEWRRMLDGCGFAKLFTLEVPLDGERVLQALRPAAAKLQAAIDHRASGRWLDAVSACREVLDAIDALFESVEPEFSWAQLQNRDTRDAMTFAERIRAVRTMIRHPTHLAHHNAGVHISREDATYIVDATCAAFRYYNERLR